LNNILNILSIDLDAFWGGPESIYVNNHKSLIQNSESIINNLRSIKTKEKKYGIDHNELLLLIDKYPKSKFNIYNFDAHHDIYALNYNIWLNPLNMRGKMVDIGNMFFQLIREEKILKYNWIVNDNESISNLKKNVSQNIGNGYISNVHILPILEFKSEMQFDIFFISISPEWIPKDKLDWIIETLCKFINLNINEKNNLKNKILKRWELGDDNSLINKDRFYFNYNYV
jgi:hypothetical protein